MLLRFNQLRKTESGFTLIELLVVILVIGILAGIAIPLFLNQRKEAIAASLASDVKNAATAMEQEMLRNKGTYPSSLPAYDKQTPGNMVYLESSRSSIDSFCLTGKNASYSDLIASYSSSDGGMLPKGQTCADATLVGASTVSALASKKALVVNTASVSAKNALTGAGITQVDTIAIGTLTALKAKDYDIVVLVGGWSQIGNSDRDAAISAYNTYGTRILTDGNDSTSLSIPLIQTVANRHSTDAGMMININPTYNEGLAPAFPYLFTATGFGSTDTWACPKTVKPGVVVIGDSPDPEAPGEKCLTMVGTTNSSGGRWIHEIFFSSNGLSSPNTDPTVAAIRWLLQ